MRIKGKTLKNILGFVSEDKSRPAICGVYFEVKKDGFNITATDGSAACIFGDFQPSECEGNYLVNFDGFKPSNGLYEIDFLPDEVFIKNKKTGQEQKFPYIYAKFPNVRQVFPSGYKKADRYVCIAAKYYKLLNACEPYAENTIPYQDNPLGPCLWNGTMFDIVIMPMLPRN